MRETLRDKHLTTVVAAVVLDARVLGVSRRGGRVGASRRRDASRRGDSDSSGGAPEERVWARDADDHIGTLGKVEQDGRERHTRRSRRSLARSPAEGSLQTLPDSLLPRNRPLFFVASRLHAISHSRRNA